VAGCAPLTRFLLAVTNHVLEPTPLAPEKAGSFPTTQWSLVLHAGAGAATQAHVAMEKLCARYWYPLYVFVRRQGRSHHEAEDCTQEFLTRLLAADGVARARREQGRFRSFLITALRNFLTNEWHRAQTEKRGGGQIPLPFAVTGADDRFAHEPRDEALSPDQAFDRSWARAMIEKSLETLRNEYEANGRAEIFSALLPLVWGNEVPGSLAEYAARLGLKEPALAVALHRLRRRLGERLRAHVLETVDNDAEADDEVRHLIAALAPRS
jgi:RNA polymerase sigma factor (sigma-70 family)